MLDGRRRNIRTKSSDKRIDRKTMHTKHIQNRKSRFGYASFGSGIVDSMGDLISAKERKAAVDIYPGGGGDGGKGKTAREPEARRSSSS